MGIWQSTQRGSEEEVDISTASQYRYPPKTGNFFSVHFIMGGEKFDSPQPESFLFGENSVITWDREALESANGMPEDGQSVEF